jgi:hypothetical protein
MFGKACLVVSAWKGGLGKLSPGWHHRWWWLIWNRQCYTIYHTSTACCSKQLWLIHSSLVSMATRRKRWNRLEMFHHHLHISVPPNSPQPLCYRPQTANQLSTIPKPSPTTCLRWSGQIWSSWLHGDCYGLRPQQQNIRLTRTIGQQRCRWACLLCQNPSTPNEMFQLDTNGKPDLLFNSAQCNRELFQT